MSEVYKTQDGDTARLSECGCVEIWKVGPENSYLRLVYPCPKHWKSVREFFDARS